MDWIFFALLAPVIYTIVNFVDKYVIEHKVKDGRGMPLYVAVAATVFGTTTWLIAGMPMASARNALLLCLSGAIAMCGFSLYFRAIEFSQASYIIALLQTTPIFVLILSVLLLDEQLVFWQIVGFITVFLAVLGLSASGVGGRVKIDKAFYLILAANALLAISSVIIKFTSGLEGLVPILVYESWGITIGGVILASLFPSMRKAFAKSFKSVGYPVLGIVLMNESFAILAKSLSFYAITLGPVALVSVLGGVQVFYGILFGLVLTLLAPSIFHENIARRELTKKCLLACVLFVGIALIGLHQ